jgi:Fe-Mn family superoxide dismutase
MQRGRAVDFEVRTANRDQAAPALPQRLMDFVLPPLPFAKTALAPHLSADTVATHYEQHHRGYLEALRRELGGTSEADQSLSEIVLASSSRRFDLAAQVYNHQFFWESLTPAGGGKPPTGPVADLLDRDFGGFSEFRHEWIEVGVNRFGSGYVWLTLEDGAAEILPTPNAETPLATGAIPLLVVDVWEHAYYLDYRGQRRRYLEVFCDHLINWDFVSRNLSRATE